MSAGPVIDEILIAVGGGETRAALLAEGRAIELIVDRADDAAAVGNIYLGRVQAVVPGIDAAFVDIGAGRAGFLARDDARPDDFDDAPRGIADHVREGEHILVQIRKPASRDKGARVSRRLGLPGRLLVFNPGRSGLFLSRRITDEDERARLAALMADIAGDDEGFVLRTLAVGASAETLAADAAYLRALWAEVRATAEAAPVPALVYRELAPVERVLRDHAGDGVARIRIDDATALAAARDYCRRFLPRLADRVAGHGEEAPLFRAHGLDEVFERALAPRLRLASGATLIFQSTEALTAIDVNTGGNVSGGCLDDTILATNLEAAAAVARELRLRNIAGLIVVDFVHMDRAADRERVAEAMRAAMAGDPMAVEIGGISPMGLLELTRRRMRPSLAESLLDACPHCDGEGLVMSAETVAREALAGLARARARSPGGGLVLIAAPAVIAALEGPVAAARGALEARLGGPVELRPEPGYARRQYDILEDQPWRG